MAAEGSGRPPARAMLVLGAKIALSVALFAVLLVKLDIHWTGLRATLGAANGSILGMALGLMLASNVLGAWQWGRLLSAVDVRLPFWKVCSYYHVGLFFNNFLPANVGGDLARVLDASRAGISRASAFSTVLLDRMIGTVALGGIAVLTTLPAIDRFHLAAVYAGVLGFFSLAVVLLWALFHPPFLATVERLLARVGLGWLSPALDDLQRRLAGFRGQPRFFMELFAIAVTVQVMRIGVHVLVARALGVHVPVTYFFLFVPLLAVIVSLPISLNGIGVREGAGILLFGMVGLARDRAFSLQFTTYLVAVAISLLGGIVFLARIPHRRAEVGGTRRLGE